MTDQELTLTAFVSDLHYAVYTVARDAGIGLADVHDWSEALKGAVHAGIREAAQEIFDTAIAPVGAPLV